MLWRLSWYPGMWSSRSNAFDDVAPVVELRVPDLEMSFKLVHFKVWDEITYPFPNFNGGIWERLSNVISYP